MINYIKLIILILFKLIKFKFNLSLKSLKNKKRRQLQDLNLRGLPHEISSLTP